MKRLLVLGFMYIAISTVGCAQNQMRTGQRQMMQPPMQAAQVNVQAPAPQHGYPQNQMLQNAHPSAVGTHAYPYYTTRSPRDFLQANPPTIGR